MLYPVSARRLVGGGECQIVLYHRMREERRVEVEPDAAFFREVDPLSEVLRLYFVASREFAVLKDGVAGVEVEALFAGDKGERLVEESALLRRQAFLSNTEFPRGKSMGALCHCNQLHCRTALKASPDNLSLLKKMKSSWCSLT